jgi:septal ring factor EnvC (AmiA/AmiB activator)
VNPDLVVRDADGKINTVRYEAVKLLNEFLKEHKKVEEQGALLSQVRSTVTTQEATFTQLNSTVAQQQKEIKALTAALREQASQIQKVSAQLELNKPAPQMVADN